MLTDPVVRDVPGQRDPYVAIKGRSYVSPDYSLVVSIGMPRSTEAIDLGFRVSLTLSTCTGASGVLE